MKRSDALKQSMFPLQAQELEELLKIMDSSANEIYSFPNKNIYLIEELHTDSSENEVSAAKWYAPFAYTDSVEDANNFCADGGMVLKGTCWAITEDTPKYRSCWLIKHLAKIDPILTLPAADKNVSGQTNPS
jgi:hypothetical protein